MVVVINPFILIGIAIIRVHRGVLLWNKCEGPVAVTRIFRRSTALFRRGRGTG